MTVYSLDVPLPDLEPVCFSMSSSNCCFLTCIQISQEAGKMVWLSHLLKNFPQFVGIYTVKGFGVVNKAEVDVFLELSWFFCDPKNVCKLISGSSAFLKSSLNIWKFLVHILKKYVKAVYCHPAYLTYMQSTSWEFLDWMKHKLESSLPGKYQ